MQFEDKYFKELTGLFEELKRHSGYINHLIIENNNKVEEYENALAKQSNKKKSKIIIADWLKNKNNHKVNLDKQSKLWRDLEVIGDDSSDILCGFEREIKNNLSNVNGSYQERELYINNLNQQLLNWSRYFQEIHSSFKTHPFYEKHKSYFVGLYSIFPREGLKKVSMYLTNYEKPTYKFGAEHENKLPELYQNIDGVLFAEGSEEETFLSIFTGQPIRKPLQIKSTRLLAYFLQQLHNVKILPDNWQSLAEKNNYFVSKTGKKIKANDLSRAITDLERMNNPTHSDIIDEVIKALKIS